MNVVDQQEIEKRREALLESIQGLPGAVLQELAGFVEYLQHKAETSDIQPPIKNNDAEVLYSPYKELEEFGLIGCGKGPSDLSTNYKTYLEKDFAEEQNAP